MDLVIINRFFFLISLFQVVHALAGRGKFENYDLPGFTSWLFQLLLLARQTRTLLQVRTPERYVCHFCYIQHILSLAIPRGCIGQAKNNYCCERWRGAAEGLCGPPGRHVDMHKYLGGLCTSKGVQERFVCVAIHNVVYHVVGCQAWSLLVYKTKSSAKSTKFQVAQDTRPQGCLSAAFQSVWLSHTSLQRLFPESYSFISKLNCCTCRCPFVVACKWRGL